jgi:hypothetical protein
VRRIDAQSDDGIEDFSLVGERWQGGFFVCVILSSELEKEPYWKEIEDYVNRRIKEEGLNDSLYIRRATLKEETQFRESDNTMLVAHREDGTREMVVGYEKYFNFAEIQESAKLYPDKSILLMHLWIAQVVTRGKYFGGCDS